jgi:hypothetical protein
MPKYIKIKEPVMALMKIRKNYQVTIPRNLRDRFNLAEGDLGRQGHQRLSLHFSDL